MARINHERLTGQCFKRYHFMFRERVSARQHCDEVVFHCRPELERCDDAIQAYEGDVELALQQGSDRGCRFIIAERQSDLRMTRMNMIQYRRQYVEKYR